MQLRAGFVLEGVRSSLKDITPRWHDLLAPVTAFELEGVDTDIVIEQPLLAVADNIISRGMPTLPSLHVESALSTCTGLTRRKENKGSVSFPLAEPLSKEAAQLLMRALCPVDPTLTADDVARTREAALGSDAEKEFYQQALPTLAGPWAPQVVEPQRPLDTITAPDQAHQFARQHVDFAVELPLMPTHDAGLVIEIDGKRYHSEAGQQKLDAKRDDACTKAGWAYVRIPARDAAHPSSEAADRIRSHFQGPYATVLNDNYESPLYASEEGRRWLTAALAPVLVARIQKTLVHLMRCGVLRLERPQWRIAVVERDIGGARLAVEDLKELLDRLFILRGLDEHLPKIDLRVYRSRSTPQMAPTSSMEEPDGWLEDESERFNAEVILDASILMRKGLRSLTSEQVDRLGHQAVVASIRSSYSQRAEPVVAAGRPIQYSVPAPPGDRAVTAADEQEEPQVAALLYLVQNLFRKTGYRPNQIDILCESLRGKDVIGLLPTGAGKSLTYQLSALLQPGITLVVAPLKSLMQDQHANLQEAGIERTSFINSTLSTGERKRAVLDLKRGRHQFVFVSPERLQIKEFRDTLSALDVPVAYCVVDEAHCVSEWGHDFRTAYLRLGDNARTFCTTLWDELPIIALTGTASFDVLADVRRELGFGEDTRTVTPESMEREELKFEVVHVPPPTLDASQQGDYWDIRNAVIDQKLSALSSLTQELPKWFEGWEDNDVESFYRPEGPQTNSGLLFVPHANGAFGVQSAATTLTMAMPSLRGHTGTFASSNVEQNDDDLIRTQDQYKANELSALVATKAFGMGIDKPNIRYVVHLNMSQSIESYYQEAGRAGRDKEEARCIILYCDQEVPTDGGEQPRSLDHDLLLYFHNNAFKGADAEKRFIYNLLKGEAIPKDDQDEPDLEALLARMQPGDPPRTVAIDFASREVIDTITSYLREHIDKRYSSRLVESAADRASDPDRFIKSLLSTFKRRYDAWPENYLQDHEARLKEWYHHIRDEQDTFRAVYRLSTIGVVSDYTVDYNAGVIRAQVKRRTAAGYVECVQQYIGRYVSPEQRRRIPEEVMAQRGENIIQKCLGYVVDFVYSTIAQKRRMALDVMEEALQDGIRHGDDAFRRRVNTYFDSRYLPDLQRKIRDRDFSLELVWDFIQRTGGSDDEVQHLRGACDRLLSEYTDNGALYLLRAFTRCLITGGSEEAFAKDFDRGWELFRNVKGLSHEDYIRGLLRFKREAGTYDRTVHDLLDRQLLKAHRTWLVDFNARFLAGSMNDEGSHATKSVREQLLAQRQQLSTD